MRRHASFLKLWRLIRKERILDEVGPTNICTYKIAGKCNVHTYMAYIHAVRSMSLSLIVDD